MNLARRLKMEYLIERLTHARVVYWPFLSHEEREAFELVAEVLSDIAAGRRKTEP